MPESIHFTQNMRISQLLSNAIRSLLPSLILSIVCTLVIYNVLRPYFPASSIIPLMIASLCPLLANVVSIVRQHRVDIFGIMVLIGLVVSIVGILMGGGQQLLLIRESFVTGAIGLLFLVSLVLPKPLGYYFGRQFLTGNDPEKSKEFAVLWESPHFHRALQGGTIFWGLLLLGEFVLRVVMVLTLPILVVLAISPIVFNVIIFGGIVVSAIWTRNALQYIHSK